jgi:hypothetical protein
VAILGILLQLKKVTRSKYFDGIILTGLVGVPVTELAAYQ